VHASDYNPDNNNKDEFNHGQHVNKKVALSG